MGENGITCQEGSDGGVLISTEGSFDAAAAWKIGDLLATAEPGAHVVIDFRRTRDFVDFAVGILAQAVTKTEAEVSLMGLGQHQRRILAYFGIKDLERTQIDDGDAPPESLPGSTRTT